MQLRYIILLLLYYNAYATVTIDQINVDASDDNTTIHIVMSDEIALNIIPDESKHSINISTNEKVLWNVAKENCHIVGLFEGYEIIKNNKVLRLDVLPGTKIVDTFISNDSYKSPCFVIVLKNKSDKIVDLEDMKVTKIIVIKHQDRTVFRIYADNPLGIVAEKLGDTVKIQLPKMDIANIENKMVVNTRRRNFCHDYYVEEGEKGNYFIIGLLKNAYIINEVFDYDKSGRFYEITIGGKVLLKKPKALKKRVPKKQKKPTKMLLTKNKSLQKTDQSTTINHNNLIIPERQPLKQQIAPKVIQHDYSTMNNHNLQDTYQRPQVGFHQRVPRTNYIESDHVYHSAEKVPEWVKKAQQQTA